MTETQFFCAEHSRKSGVDIIGSASEHEIYIAIACPPPPWASDEIESKSVPDNLRELIEEVDEEYDRFPARFLFIYNENLNQDGTLLLIFRKQLGLSNSYTKQEFHLADLQAVAPFVKHYLIGELIDTTPTDDATKDVLICTHGSRDRCCARFGNPLYHQALKIVEERSLNHIRIWQASHIDRHRMAPTAVTFPDARYYGYLSPAALESILTRTGDIQYL